MTLKNVDIKVEEKYALAPNKFMFTWWGTLRIVTRVKIFILNNLVSLDENIKPLFVGSLSFLSGVDVGFLESTASFGGFLVELLPEL